MLEPLKVKYLTWLVFGKFGFGSNIALTLAKPRYFVPRAMACSIRSFGIGPLQIETFCQGNLSKGIDNKKKCVAEKITIRLLSSQQHTFYNATKWFEIAVIFIYMCNFFHKLFCEWETQQYTPTFFCKKVKMKKNCY